jgi:hypothetical protein
LCEFTDASETEATLNTLMEREDGPFVARLARAPGSREARYGHLFSGTPVFTPEEAEEETVTAADSGGATLAARVTALEELVAQLHAQIEALKEATAVATPAPMRSPEQ